MEVTADDLLALIQDIWTCSLELTATPAATPHDEMLSEATLDGLINITGDWQGTVAVQVSRGLASRIATIMFRLDSATPALEDMQDALGEITNMTGGNIKALMTGSCHLSLPAVVEGTTYTIRVPSTKVVTRVPFECNGMHGAVSIMTAAAPRASQAPPPA